MVAANASDYSQACVSISESPRQFIQARKADLHLCRLQESSFSLSLHVFLLANLSAHVLTTNTSIYCSNKKVSTVHNCCMNKTYNVLVPCRDPVLVIVPTYLLFPPLLPLVLRVLQHLFSPQVKEVGRVGVELQTLLPIVPAGRQRKPTNHVALWLTCWRRSVSFLL